MPCDITRKQTLQAIFKAHYADCHLFVISTHIHGKAQTALGRFVVDILYKQVCNKYTKNRTAETPSLRAIMRHCLRDHMFSHFDTIPGMPDRHTTAYTVLA